MPVHCALLQFEFRKKGGAGPAGNAVAKPLVETQPVESRRARDRSASRRDEPRDAAVRPRSKDAKEKTTIEPPVREWDRHKLRRSPPREREDRDRRGREEKPAKARDKKDADRHERDRSRHERRGRERNEKSG